MVVYSQLDLGYLAYFFGLRVNQVVIEELRAAGFRDARESHGYVIQHVIEKDRSITELAQRMEVSQQAASKVVAELAKLGVLELVPGEDRRAKNVRLSKRGWAGVKAGRKIRQNIERRLIRRIGAEEYEIAKSILAECLKALGGVDRIQTRRVLPPQ